MPRNKSEKANSCPEAYAYLSECERWFTNGDASAFNQLWLHLPRPVSRAILDCCGTRPSTVGDQTAWRRSVVACIRKLYAP